jgi:4-amino-4-deoxy-L-arabinose transferase-like glycosyltransferase
MKQTRPQTYYVGIALIAFGVVALLNLWWMLPIAFFSFIGYRFYTERRNRGQFAEAVQGGLWGFGLALLYLVGFWPGLLLLAGASLLARGRESQIDDKVQELLGRAKQSWTNRSLRPSLSTTTYAPTTPQHSEEQQVASGKTIRL